jgi:hypothetical protein
MLSYQLRYNFLYLSIILLLLFIKKYSDYKWKRLIVLFLFPLAFSIILNIYVYLVKIGIIIKMLGI